MIGFKRSKGVVREDRNLRTRTSSRGVECSGMVVAILLHRHELNKIYNEISRPAGEMLT